MVDEEGRKLQYTAPQKRIESKAKRNAYVLGIEKRRFGITEKETLLSSCNGKTSHYEKFKSYLVEKTKLNNETSDLLKVFENDKKNQINKLFAEIVFSEESSEKMTRSINSSES